MIVLLQAELRKKIRRMPGGEEFLVLDLASASLASHVLSSAASIAERKAVGI
jgi:hypothetical protein